MRPSMVAVVLLPAHVFLDILLVASEIALAVRRRASSQTTRKDAGSLRLLWVVICLAMSAGHLVAGLGPHLANGWATGGAIVFLGGSALRWWSVIHLGRFFTVDVAVADDHALVETGPYRWLRHPSYSGLLLQFLGIGLSLQSAWSVAVICLPAWLALHRRMQIEEDALREKLGQAYVAYCARTPRLFPFY